MLCMYCYIYCSPVLLSLGPLIDFVCCIVVGVDRGVKRKRPAEEDEEDDDDEDDDA